MRPLAQARNPYSRSWLWIPDSRFARPGMTMKNSKPQHHLRDDLALDFRRTAEDRISPAVEIFRYHRQHRFGNTRRLVELVERPHRLDIKAVVADHLDAEPRYRLADFANPQLQQRGH